MMLRLKVMELHNSEGGTDFLIVDEDATAAEILCQDDAAYAVCGDRNVAELFVAAVHNHTTKPKSEVQ